MASGAKTCDKPSKKPEEPPKKSEEPSKKPKKEPVKYEEQMAQKCGVCGKWLSAFDETSQLNDPESPYHRWECHEECVGYSFIVSE